jgi:hypothetical protein
LRSDSNTQELPRVRHARDKMTCDVHCAQPCHGEARSLVVPDPVHPHLCLLCVGGCLARFRSPAMESWDLRRARDKTSAPSSCSECHQETPLAFQGVRALGITRSPSSCLIRSKWRCWYASSGSGRIPAEIPENLDRGAVLRNVGRRVVIWLRQGHDLTPPERDHTADVPGRTEVGWIAGLLPHINSVGVGAACFRQY